MSDTGLMKFCREWYIKLLIIFLIYFSISNNLLYAAEDREHRRLVYYCKRCSHREQSGTACIYANQIQPDFKSDV
jgi:DNA-directed RNA polymerase subunit M/transcription elongation factor TFIIS